MKTLQPILALTFATLLIAAFSFAAEEPEVRHHFKLKLGADGELIDLDADDLAVGETRQIYTDSGKEVLITRTEEAYDIEVDGKKIDLGMLHGDAHHSVVVHGDGTSKVVVHSLGEGDGGHEYAFVHRGEGHGPHHWVSKGEDGEAFDVMIERVSPAEHLLASGVLDDLDEDTRQRILDTLKEIEHPRIIKKRIHVDVDEEDEGDS